VDDKKYQLERVMPIVRSAMCMDVWRQRHPGGHRDPGPGGHLDSRSRIKYGTSCAAMTPTLRAQSVDTPEHITCFSAAQRLV